MDSTWQSPNVTGVFIRLRWNEIHLTSLPNPTGVAEVIDANVAVRKRYCRASLVER